MARDSGAAITARRAGIVDQVDAMRIVVRATEDVAPGDPGVDIHRLRKFQRSNQNTCINQRPLVKVGDAVSKGEFIADGPSTDLGELALRQGVLVAFMPWNGYNYEDSILISSAWPRTTSSPRSTSRSSRSPPATPSSAGGDHPRHPERRRGGAAQPRRGRHRLHRRRGRPGDILVGKITPGEPDDAREKLLRAIFGEKASDVRDTCLRCRGRLRHGRRGAGVQPPRRRQGRARAADRARDGRGLSATATTSSRSSSATSTRA